MKKIDSTEGIFIEGIVLIIISAFIAIGIVEFKSAGPLSLKGDSALQISASIAFFFVGIIYVFYHKELIYDDLEKKIKIEVVFLRKYRATRRNINISEIDSIGIEERRRNGISYRAFLKLKTNEIYYILRYNQGFMDLDPLASKLAAEMSLPRIDIKS